MSIHVTAAADPWPDIERLKSAAARVSKAIGLPLAVEHAAVTERGETFELEGKYSVAFRRGDSFAWFAPLDTTGADACIYAFQEGFHHAEPTK